MLSTKREKFSKVWLRSFLWILLLTNILALKKYEEAVQLVPDDLTPLGNLSAAQFEIGNYTECISTAEKALTLLNDAKDSSAAAVDKLNRKSKSTLYPHLRDRHSEGKVEIAQ
jgi:tetratricopeptide (TPR) repeat protein